MIYMRGQAGDYDHWADLTDPARAERLWLAMALATLWTVSVGCLAETSCRCHS